MSTQLIPFTFSSNHQVRVHLDDTGAPWFVAKDVALALGYAKPENAISAHCKHQRTTPKQGGGFLNIIPEGDIYRLVARSHLPGALKFEEWIFDEVLPSIRKTGSYSVPGTPHKAPALQGVSLPGLPCLFPAYIPGLPPYDRRSISFDRFNYLWEPLLDWCKALTGSCRRMDIAFLEAVIARAAGRVCYAAIPLSALPIIRDWIYERIDEAQNGGASEAYPRLSFHALAGLKNDLVMLEAAIEGCDLGEPDLKDALACKTLEVIQQVEAMGL